MGGENMIGLGRAAREKAGVTLGEAYDEFVRWITEAWRDATRTQRVTKTIEMLRTGRHR